MWPFTRNIEDENDEELQTAFKSFFEVDEEEETEMNRMINKLYENLVTYLNLVNPQFSSYYVNHDDGNVVTQYTEYCFDILTNDQEPKFSIAVKIFGEDDYVNTGGVVYVFNGHEIAGEFELDDEEAEEIRDYFTKKEDAKAMNNYALLNTIINRKIDEFNNTKSDTKTVDSST